MLQFLGALVGETLSLAFRPSREFRVWIVERPGISLTPEALARLRADCDSVVRACLGGESLDYGLFAADGAAWDRSVITLVTRIADGRPVAFMLTFPDVNDALAKIKGKLFPFGWFHMLRWLRHPKGAGMRVPLMGVLKELHNSRLASQLAFMMIETIRVESTTKYGSVRGELGWVLEDNQGMVAIADTIQSKINREYVIYERMLG